MNIDFDSVSAAISEAYESLRAVKAHPEGTKALLKWMDGMDFPEQFGCRRKQIGETNSALLALSKASFTLDGEELVADDSYGLYVWKDGEWQIYEE